MCTETLIVTMNQEDHSLLDKMNIQTDALIGNQCRYNRIEEFEWKGHYIKYYSFNEKGVGLNRNNILMRAQGDICIFADDDMYYYDGYADAISKAFGEYKDIDIIVFNIDGDIHDKNKIERVHRVRWYNFMRYGAVRIAVRRESIIKNGIFFNLLFGGGAKYQSGEDTLFIRDCLKRGLKIIAIPVSLGKLTGNRPSTWFQGYDEKFFYDKGKLFEAISRRWARAICLQDAIRHSKLYGRKWKEVYRLLLRGIR